MMDSASELLSEEEQQRIISERDRFLQIDEQSRIITELVDVNLKSVTEIIEWHDTETDAVGWCVKDTRVNGISGGGIFMHKGATVEEVAGIGRNMSLKFTVCDPQIGGAKSGIRFDHTDSRAKDVLRRFIIYIGDSLRTNYVTAGDLNTDDRYIESVIQKDVGQPTCQAALATEIAKRCNLPNLSKQLSNLISTPATPYFPLIEGAVGYGIARAVELACKKTGITKPRVVIQGFGAVGTSLAYFLQTENLATVVAIADQDCIVRSSNGIDIVELLKIRKSLVGQLSQWDNPECKKLRATAEKNIRPLVEAAPNKNLSVSYRQESESNVEFLNRLICMTPADVFLPLWTSILYYESYGNTSKDASIQDCCFRSQHSFWNRWCRG